MVHCLPRPRHVAPPPAPSTRARALAIGSPAGFSRNASTHRPRRWSTSHRSRIQPLRERRLTAAGRQRPSWPLFREPPDVLAPKATHGPRPPPLRTTGAASASSSVAAGRPTPGQAAVRCLPFAQILKYGYKKSLIRTKEGEVKWVPTKKLPSSSFASSACVVL